MSALKIFKAAAALSMLAATTPVFAQAAIQEPGAFAFYHPNADVLNGGRPAAAGAMGAFASVPFGDAYPTLESAPGPYPRYAPSYRRPSYGRVSR